MTGLREFTARLHGFELETTQRQALEDAAQRIREAVQAELSHSPGSNHETPWLRSGDLRDSIVHEVEGDGAVIGSTSLVAVYQEMGTRHDQPRPFLAPAAATLGEAIAETIGKRVVDTIRTALAGGAALGIGR